MEKEKVVLKNTRINETWIVGEFKFGYYKEENMWDEGRERYFLRKVNLSIDTSFYESRDHWAASMPWTSEVMPILLVKALNLPEVRIYGRNVHEDLTFYLKNEENFSTWLQERKKHARKFISPQSVLEKVISLRTVENGIKEQEVRKEIKFIAREIIDRAHQIPNKEIAYVIGNLK